jgi:hypothetical protein
VVLTIKPLCVQDFHGGFQRKSKQIPIGLGLDDDSADYLAVGDTRLVFQKSILFEKGEIGEDGKVSLTKMDEDVNLEHGIWIQMGKLNFIVIKQPTKEIASGYHKSPLEESLGNYDFIGVWTRDLLIICQSPFKNGEGRKKVVIDQLEDLTFIDRIVFEYFSRVKWPSRQRKSSQGMGAQMGREKMVAVRAWVRKEE